MIHSLDIGPTYWVDQLPRKKLRRDAAHLAATHCALTAHRHQGIMDFELLRSQSSEHQALKKDAAPIRRALDVTMVAHHLVSVVDDDASVRESLPDLLEVRGFDVEVFESAEKFLTSKAIDQTDCIILDVSMPGMTGPELQEELANQKRSIPIIFITARADEVLFARLLDRGAVDCLVKPFSDRKLREALQIAFSV